jgi:hypothetical protein
VSVGVVEPLRFRCGSWEGMGVLGWEFHGRWSLGAVPGGGERSGSVGRCPERSRAHGNEPPCFGSVIARGRGCGAVWFSGRNAPLGGLAGACSVCGGGFGGGGVKPPRFGCVIARLRACSGGASSVRNRPLYVNDSHGSSWVLAASSSNRTPSFRVARPGRRAGERALSPLETHPSEVPRGQAPRLHRLGFCTAPGRRI